MIDECNLFCFCVFFCTVLFLVFILLAFIKHITLVIEVLVTVLITEHFALTGEGLFRRVPYLLLYT